jgi:hypothetical protein
LKGGTENQRRRIRTRTSNIKNQKNKKKNNRRRHEEAAGVVHVAAAGAIAEAVGSR